MYGQEWDRDGNNGTPLFIPAKPNHAEDVSRTSPFNRNISGLSGTLESILSVLFKKDDKVSIAATSKM